MREKERKGGFGRTVEGLEIVEARGRGHVWRGVQFLAERGSVEDDGGF